MKYDIDDSMKRLKTIVVGIGKQASEDHIPALLASTNYEIVSLVEKDSSKHHEIEKRYGITVYQSIEEATSADTPDAAVLTLPHFMLKVLRRLIFQVRQVRFTRSPSLTSRMLSSRTYITHHFLIKIVRLKMQSYFIAKLSNYRFGHQRVM